MTLAGGRMPGAGDTLLKTQSMTVGVPPKPAALFVNVPSLLKVSV
jgi:hypothetical protein